MGGGSACGCSFRPIRPRGGGQRVADGNGPGSLPGARAGARRVIPEGLGTGEPVYNRHRRWSLDGTWEKILGQLRAGCDPAEGQGWTVSADSTVVRAHQHAAGGRRALPAELVTGGVGE